MFAFFECEPRSPTEWRGCKFFLGQVIAQPLISLLALGMKGDVVANPLRIQGDLIGPIDVRAASATTFSDDTDHISIGR